MLISDKAKKIVYLILVSSGLLVVVNGNTIINKVARRVFSNNFINSKTRVNICYNLQYRLNNILANRLDDWSVTVMNNKGVIISDINGSKPRIPASNQKLITTAYAIDRLGPNFTFKTGIYKTIGGELELEGNGDPDLNIKKIKDIALRIYSSTNSIRNNSKRSSIIIREVIRDYWWPGDWYKEDRFYSYGAPITTLPVGSNSSYNSLTRPVVHFKNTLNTEIRRLGGEIDINVKSKQKHYLLRLLRLPVYVVKSSSVQSLLSVANSESHNFTAEVLLRNAAGTWDVEKASRRVYRWLKNKNIDIQGLSISDGSGLSRTNRLTTNAIASLLMTMENHKYNDIYKSSLAISGVRGTLTNKLKQSNLKGYFRAKTGTLTGVRSMSGYLTTDKGFRIVSIISHNSNNPDSYIGLILENVRVINQCS